jgi:hypothetical protein
MKERARGADGDQDGSGGKRKPRPPARRVLAEF